MAPRGRAGENGKRHPGGITNLPVNQWRQVASVELKGEERRKGVFDYSQPVYVPTRGQVLQWGGFQYGGGRSPAPHNSVLVFDAEKGDWVADYPTDPKARLAPSMCGHGTKNGVSNRGVCHMTAKGIPGESMIVNGVCWDSRRKKLVYTMRGLMAAYDPATKKWSDMNAKTLIDGKEYPGGPPVYAVGTGYDPVNDEIVMSPHFCAPDGPKNVDRLDVDGRVFGHLGTFRFSFKDRTWRRVGPQMGTPQVKKARRATLALLKVLSFAADGAWSLGRGKLKDRAAEVTVGLKKSLQMARGLGAKLPAEGKPCCARAVPLLEKAAKSAAAGKWREAADASGRAIWELDQMLEHHVRTEPPPRCAAPLVYDPQNKCLVMFGGHSGLVRADIVKPKQRGWGAPGARDDTWIYDCKTRQWREVAAKRRPPVAITDQANRLPKLFYDPGSKRVVLLLFFGGKNGRTEFWALNVKKGEWFKALEKPWSWPLNYQGAYGSRTPVWNVALDEKRGVVLVAQSTSRRNKQRKRTWTRDTYAMRLKLGAGSGTPAPVRKYEPLRPHWIPPDKPGRAAELKALPANEWVGQRSSGRGPNQRLWGNIACDQVRGHVHYFGGGHSTYQVNDVAIYSVGANAWVHAPGDNNDFVPPTGWGGTTMGLRGGNWAHHMRNQYVAFDGRMYTSPNGGFIDGRGAIRRLFKSPRHDLIWFYDAGRGGLWRMQRLKHRKLPQKYRTPKGHCPNFQRVDEEGRVVAFTGQYSVMGNQGTYRHTYDVDSLEHRIVSNSGQMPGGGGEGRAWCLMEDKAKSFHCNGKEAWVCDNKTQTFARLNPKRKPSGRRCRNVEYIQGQDAVWAYINEEQWFYSFKHENWAKLEGEAPNLGGRGNGPYGQGCYVIKYGVLVSPWKIMRPDVSKLNWGR
jgi:hypothetical protein